MFQAQLSVALYPIVSCPFDFEIAAMKGRVINKNIARPHTKAGALSRILGEVAGIAEEDSNDRG